MPSSSDPRPPPQDPSRRPRVPGVESTDGPAQRGEAGLWEVVLLACVRFSWGSGPGTLAPHWADSCPSPSRGARRARAGTAGGQGAPQSWQGAEGPCRGEGWHPAGRGWAWGAGPAPLPAEPHLRPQGEEAEPAPADRSSESRYGAVRQGLGCRGAVGTP